MHVLYQQSRPNGTRCTSLFLWLSTAVNCGPLEAPEHGSLYGEKTTYPNRVSLFCDRGYDVIGSTVRVCQPNGSWSGSDATCARETGFPRNIYYIQS